MKELISFGGLGIIADKNEWGLGINLFRNLNQEKGVMLEIIVLCLHFYIYF